MTTPGSGLPEDRSEELARQLNRECHCISIDADALRRELERDPENHDLYHSIIETRPYLFSASAVFVSRTDVERMAAVIRSIEEVVALPGYRETVLGWAPAIARSKKAAPAVVGETPVRLLLKRGKPNRCSRC